ncbi:type IV secretory system conjugative DNA transfer family protein [Helicobacter anatolicus]
MKVIVYICLFYGIFPLIVFLFFFLSFQKKTHGYAEFAKLKDLAKMKLKTRHSIKSIKNGFLFGAFKGKYIFHHNPLATLIVAPPGTGKTASIIVPNLLSVENSAIVLDIKGELCSLTAGYRQKVLKNKILIFDPMRKREEEIIEESLIDENGESFSYKRKVAITKDTDLCFNPFDKKLIEKMNYYEKIRLVNEIAETIFVDDKKDHWLEQAKNLFVFFALYDILTQGESNFHALSQATKRDFKKLIHPQSKYHEMLFEVDENGNTIEANFVDCERLFYQQISELKYCDINEPRNYIDESLEQIKIFVAKSGKEEFPETLRKFARQWVSIPRDEFGSIKSTYGRYMQVFSYEQVANATKTMNFNYEDLREEKITIYIRIAQTDIDFIAPLIRIFLENIAKNMLLKESKKLVYWYLDEFVRFGKLSFLMEMPALSRSYGQVPIYITQSESLISKHYGKEDYSIINEICHYKVIFKSGSEDFASKISKEIGNYTRKHISKSKGKKVDSGSTSISFEGTPLVTTQDILNLPDDEALLLVTGFKARPIKLKIVFYFKNKIYNKRTNLILEEKIIRESQQDKELENELDKEENLAVIEATQEFDELQKLLTSQESYIKEITQEKAIFFLNPPNKKNVIDTQTLNSIFADEDFLKAKSCNKKIEIEESN